MIEVFDIPQNSEEWINIRLGIPTSSMFRDVMAKTPKGTAPGKTQITYMRKLAAEIITGVAMEGPPQTAAMQRGHDMEDEARKMYAFMQDVDPTQVGFVRNGPVGSSPDSFVGEDGMVEIKTKTPHLLIEWIEKDQVPPEHKAQLQGQLMVCEREWVDVVGYWPGMPLFLKREYADKAYISNMENEITRFLLALDKTVEMLREYKAAA